MRNKTIQLIITVMLLTGMTGIAVAAPPTDQCSGVTGTVWATLSDYNRSTQIFAVGETVYITGDNFADGSTPLSGTVFWNVTNQTAGGGGPGGFGPEIASGSTTLTLTNPYALYPYPAAKPAYIIPMPILTITPALVGTDLRLNAWHSSWPTQCVHGQTFKVAVDTFYGGAIPEFPTVALPIAAVIGMLFFFQNRKKKQE